MSFSLLNTNELQRIFQKLDKNDDGFLSLEELNWLLDKTNLTLTIEQLESIVGKSKLDMNEFVFFYESIAEKNMGENKGDFEEEEEEKDLINAFKVFDLNKDGYISSEELGIVLTRLGLWDEKSGRDCMSMIVVFDTNLDGVLDFQEFKSMMLLTIS